MQKLMTGSMGPRKAYTPFLRLQDKDFFTVTGIYCNCLYGTSVYILIFLTLNYWLLFRHPTVVTCLYMFLTTQCVDPSFYFNANITKAVFLFCLFALLLSSMIDGVIISRLHISIRHVGNTNTRRLFALFRIQFPF